MTLRSRISAVGALNLAAGVATAAVAAFATPTIVAPERLPSSPATSAQDRDTVVARMIEAHGGMERWRAAPSVRFQNIFFNPGAAQRGGMPWWISEEVIEQGGRRAYHDWPLDGARLGWDGERVWSRGWKQANPPSFQALFFYWFVNLPWLTQDDAVELGELGTGTFPGTDAPMWTVPMRFSRKPAPGKTVRDSYRLFIDQRDHRLRGYEYSIGFAPMLRAFNIPEDGVMGPVLRIIDRHVTVDGLLVPAVMHTTSADGAQTFGYHALVGYSFSEPFDEARAAMPADAVIDRSEES